MNTPYERFVPYEFRRRALELRRTDWLDESRFEVHDARHLAGPDGDLAAFIRRASNIDRPVTIDLGRGTYRMNGRVDLPNTAGVVLHGDGATIQYRGTNASMLFRLGVRDGRLTANARMGAMIGVDFDIRGPDPRNRRLDTDVGILTGRFHETFYAENVRLRGNRHSWQKVGGEYRRIGSRMTWRVDMVRPDAFAYYYRLRLPDGDIHTPEAYQGQTGSVAGHAIPISADPPHRGVNLYHECEVRDFFDNGYYVSNNNGINCLWGCYVENCVAGNMRIGHNDLVVGGTSRQDSSGRDGRNGQCLTVDRGDNVRVVGLHCEGFDFGASEAIQLRTQAEEVDLVGVTLDARSGRRPVRLSRGGSGRANVRVRGCDWRDTGPRGTRTSVYINNANVQFEGSRLRVSRKDDVWVRTGSVNGRRPGRYSARQLGLTGSPAPIDEFLDPEPLIDWDRAGPRGRDRSRQYRALLDLEQTLKELTEILS